MRLRRKARTEVRTVAVLVNLDDLHTHQPGHTRRMTVDGVTFISLDDLVARLRTGDWHPSVLRAATCIADSLALWGMELALGDEE